MKASLIKDPRLHCHHHRINSFRAWHEEERLELRSRASSVGAIEETEMKLGSH